MKAPLYSGGEGGGLGAEEGGGEPTKSERDAEGVNVWQVSRLQNIRIRRDGQQIKSCHRG